MLTQITYFYENIFQNKVSEKRATPNDWRMPIDTLSLTKETRIYNGEKTISLTSGAGKTGQLHVKE